MVCISEEMLCVVHIDGVGGHEWGRIGKLMVCVGD